MRLAHSVDMLDVLNHTPPASPAARWGLAHSVDMLDALLTRQGLEERFLALCRQADLPRPEGQRLDPARGDRVAATVRALLSPGARS